MSSALCRLSYTAMVGLSGLEPLISSLSGKRSHLLNHRPVEEDRGVEPHGREAATGFRDRVHRRVRTLRGGCAI